MDIVVVSGLSGSGKTVALDMLEDLGYYCLDNVPVQIMGTILERLRANRDSKFERLAIGLDSRPLKADLPEALRVIDSLKVSDEQCVLVYLHAADDILLQRYRETRRRHPLSDPSRSLREAITYERDLLSPVAQRADVVLDTSKTSIHELREAMRDRLAGERSEQLSILFQSFGYKYGVPADADFVFDARFLPNPYWEPGLRPLTGLDDAVRDFLGSQESVRNFTDDISRFLDRWIPEIEASNRSYLTVAIGCTGGQHRSVFLAETLAAVYGPRYPQVHVRHTALPA
jgi:UPF0042 nucleotide-binding protein